MSRPDNSTTVRSIRRTAVALVPRCLPSRAAALTTARASPALLH
ncbi:MAG TPA: hypothetical protein VJT72_04985 [Pseudonocardiaceae bacterium]|nr:hypothetical protein [Pseudonocardiaceae bacterium]